MVDNEPEPYQTPSERREMLQPWYLTLTSLNMPATADQEGLKCEERRVGFIEQYKSHISSSNACSCALRQQMRERKHECSPSYANDQVLRD